MSREPYTGPAKVLVYDPSEQFGSRISNLVAGWAEPTSAHAFTDFVALAQEIEKQGPDITLVAAINVDVQDSLARIRIVHEEYPAIPVVLVLPVGFWLEPVELIKVGAIELLPDASDDTELNDGLLRAARIGRAGAAFRLPHDPDEEVAPTSGKVVSFVSANGGVGRTFLATNAAAWLRRDGLERVCLIDLGGPYGSAGTALRLRPSFTVAQACRAASDPEDFQEHLSEFFTSHELGFDVLAAGDDPSDWVSVAPYEAGKMIEIVRDNYDVVVIDAPSAMNPLVEEIVTRSDECFLVGSLDVPALRSIRLYLNQLQELGIEEKPHLIINRCGTGYGIEISDAMDYLDSDVVGWIPADDDVRRSMNLGGPILAQRPKHPVSRAIDEALAHLGGAGDPRDGSNSIVEGLSPLAAKWFKRSRAS